MKLWTAAAASAFLFLLGLGWYYWSLQGPKSSNLTKPATVPPPVSLLGHGKPQKSRSLDNTSQDLRHAEFEKLRQAREEETTLRKLERAKNAENLNPASFGKNGPFLRKKFADLFASWNLSSPEIDQFISVLENDSYRMALAMIQSTRSWPVEGGHAGNRERDTAHTKELVEKYQAIQAETRLQLAAIVGEERVREYEQKRRAESK